MSLIDEVDDLNLNLPPAPDETGVATCAKPDCTNPLPGTGEPGYHRLRRYCDDHQPRSSPGARKRRAQISPDSDAPVPPRVITNNFTVKSAPAKSKVTGDVGLVEEGATVLLNFVPMVLALFGDDVCPPAIAEAIPAIAHQLALLSKYHPVLKKIFASGEGSGELFAWIGLLITASPVIITVLAHHNVIKGDTVEKLSMASTIGKAVVDAGVEADGDVAGA